MLVHTHTVSPRRQRVFHCAGVLAFYTTFFCLYFSPIWLSDRLLAPGDGTGFGWPAFSKSWTLWTPDLFAGFPVAADSQMQTYYAMRWLFSLLGAWNGYIVSAYVIAACGTYGYVFTLTRRFSPHWLAASSTPLADFVSRTLGTRPSSMVPHGFHSCSGLPNGCVSEAAGAGWL